MMTLVKGSIWTLAICFAVSNLQETLAAPQSSENAIDQLYENLLQREYAGPISFPDHQVERKAQRSPSLRLRFGRSDPDMLQAGKRWFGDVNQKPIRSPSLRLRFGRRSDPSVPLHDFNTLNEFEQEFGYNRPVRKPARLRWGRSLPLLEHGIEIENENQRIENEDAITTALTTESLRMLLNALRELDENRLSTDEEYNRETRKPMRLRFGRSAANSNQNTAQLPSTTEEAVQSNQKDDLSNVRKD